MPHVSRISCHEDAAASGDGGHVGGEDVVGVAVEVLAGPVIPHRGARVGVSGGDLDIRRSTPASSMVVTNVCRSMCGCALAIRTPATLARCRRRRVAAWRSIRVPRLLSRIGPPVRTPIARSIARPTAGGSGTRTTLVPLPHTRRTRWPCSSPRSVMSAPVASKIRRPSKPSMATSAEAHGSVESRAAVRKASNCRWVNPRG
jgi:hypothetical protein